MKGIVGVAGSRLAKAVIAKLVLVRVVLASATLVALGATGMLAAQTSTAQTPSCTASYAITSSWNGGFNWVVTVDAGSAPIAGWTVTWAYADGQTVSNPYNAVVTQSGSNVTATNVSYNGSVAAGASTQFGGGGTWSGTNSVPVLACSAQGSGTTTTVGTTSTTATTGPSTTSTSPGGSTTTTGSSETTTTTWAPTTPTTTFTPGPYTGNATYFSGLGAPYGGCGLPQANVDSQNFLALNVQNTPGNYSTALPRPIPAADESEIGMFENGLNCGRWVHVVIGDYCTGTNDGAPNEPFCRNGNWVSDQYNGAQLDFVVADSCQDGNAWCRDDPYHVDLAQGSLNNFTQNGQPVSGLPNKWNNRQVSWSFEPAPNYSGDINIGFIAGASPYWSAIAVSHLQNGIHGVDYFSNGTWTAASMDADMGDDYIVAPTTSGGSSYEIRVHDVTGALINGGREYLFSFPSSCGTQCSPSYTPATYTTSGGSGTTTTAPPTTSPSTTTTSSSTTTTSATTTSSTTATSATTTSTTPGTTTTAPTSTTTPPSTTTAPTTTTTTTGGGSTCSATYSVTSQWSGGFDANVTVTAGPSAISNWKVTWAFPNGQTVVSAWNAQVTQSGPDVTATNESYNGSLSAGASTQWGFEGTWSTANGTPTLTCT